MQWPAMKPEPPVTRTRESVMAPIVRSTRDPGKIPGDPGNARGHRRAPHTPKMPFDDLPRI